MNVLIDIMESINKLSLKPRDEFKGKIKSSDVTEYNGSARIKLADFQQHLEATDKKCKLMKNRLDYMKMVYQSVGFGGIEAIVSDVPSLHHSSNSILMNNCDIHHTLRRKQDRIKYHDPSSNVKQCDNENLSIMIDTTNPINSVTTNKNKFKNYFSTNKKEIKRKKILNQMNQTAKISRENVSTAPIISTQSSDSSNNLNNIENVIEPQGIFIMSPSTVKNTEKSELILKLTSPQLSTYNENKLRKTNKPMKVTTTSENFPNNLTVEQSNIDNIGSGRMEKFRRRKTRMRSTNLKSITANKSTYIMQEIQPMNKIKTHVIPVKKISQLELNNATTVDFSEEKPITEQQLNEVVEIYHNIAAKNKSPSVVSSKQQFKIEELNFKLKDEPVTCIEIDNNGTKQNIDNTPDKNKKQMTNHFHTEMKQNIYNSPDLEWTCRENQEELDPLSIKHHHGDCQQPVTLRSWCRNTFAVRSYQQPTISSKLKRVDRCYFGARVNLQNIPFVVGTSLTPSHNLGLNIQQIFSLMKHRQLTMSSDIKPVPIRTIDDSIDPKVLLSDQLMDDNEKQKMPMSSRQILQQDTQHGHNEGSFKIWNNPGDSGDILVHITQSSMLRQREKELNMSKYDTKKCQSMTNNFTRIRNVLTRLQDQFEAMLNKHEKLAAQVEKGNNPNLKKELAELEKEIVVKEEEIVAVVGLYKEILALKHQMKLLREKNSVICITSHRNGKHPRRISGPSISARRSRIPHQHLQSFNCRKSTTVNNTREPMVATRLVGLLRQIQSYQQQLIAS